METDPLSAIPNLVEQALSASTDDPPSTEATDTSPNNAIDSTNTVANDSSDHQPNSSNTSTSNTITKVEAEVPPSPVIPAEMKITEKEGKVEVEVQTKTPPTSTPISTPTSPTPRKKQAESKSSSTKNKAKSSFKSLPRTVRWKIQLGLLSLPVTKQTKINPSDSQVEPMQVETVLNSTNEKSQTDPLSGKDVTTITTNEKTTDPPKPAKPSSISSTTTSVQHDLKDIFQFNQENIHAQQTRFDSLAKKHLWESSPLALIEKEEDDDNETKQSTADKTPQQQGSNNLPNEPKSLPTTSPTTNIKKVSCHKGSDPLSAMLMEETGEDEEVKKSTDPGHSPAANAEKKEGSPSKKGNASWSEFYSSRETLDIIEKDLHRLAPSHHIVTPISILYTSSLSLYSQDDSKDTTFKIPEEAVSPTNETLEERKKRRAQLLSQMLFIYARHNPSLGYRQGMHEILSFILIAFEVDFHNAYNPKITKKEEDKTFDWKIQQQIFQRDKIAHDIFALFETIMYYLSPCYDSDPQSITPPPHLQDKATSKKLLASISMVNVGEAVLQQIRINGSDALYNHLTEDVNIPPQLYCARWVRLMFTREISSVHQSLFLWDKIFHSMFRKHCAMLPILEYICAAMIFRIEDKFNIYYGDEEEEDDYDDDPNESINALMNYPPIDDVKLFWKNVTDLMEGKLIKASMERNRLKNMNKEYQPVGFEDTINKVQNFAKPFLIGAGRPKSGSLHDQSQENRTPQLHLNGVFKKMNNMYHEAIGQHGREDGNHQQYQPLRPEEYMNNKHVHGDRYHAEQMRRQQNEQRQKLQVKQTLKRVSNTWNKAIDSIGGSIENLVVNASARGNQTIGSAHNTIPHQDPMMNSFETRSNNIYQADNQVAFSEQKQSSYMDKATDQRLSQSVSVLTKYLQSIQDAGGQNIPPLVWQAVADIDAVRLQMTAKSAPTQEIVENNAQYPS